MTAFAYVSAGAGAARVTVDGQDVSKSVLGVEFGHYGGSPPALTLNLLPGEQSLALDDAQMTIDPTTARLLVRLGWTPPKETK